MKEFHAVLNGSSQRVQVSLTTNEIIAHNAFYCAFSVTPDEKFEILILSFIPILDLSARWVGLSVHIVPMVQIQG